MDPFEGKRRWRAEVCMYVLEIIGCLRLEMGVNEIEAAAYPTEEIDGRSSHGHIFFNMKKKLKEKNRTIPLVLTVNAASNTRNYELKLHM